MRCAICDHLRREHDDLCGQEAALTLAERKEMIVPTRPREPASLLSRDRILSLRKRQARVASDLDQHNALAHSA